MYIVYVLFLFYNFLFENNSYTLYKIIFLKRGRVKIWGLESHTVRSSPEYLGVYLTSFFGLVTRNTSLYLIGFGRWSASRETHTYTRSCRAGDPWHGHSLSRAVTW